MLYLYLLLFVGGRYIKTLFCCRAFFFFSPSNIIILGVDTSHLEQYILSRVDDTFLCLWFPVLDVGRHAVPVHLAAGPPKEKTIYAYICYT